VAGVSIADPVLGVHGYVAAGLHVSNYCHHFGGVFLCCGLGTQRGNLLRRG
jgi:hypothetical protein